RAAPWRPPARFQEAPAPGPAGAGARPRSRTGCPPREARGARASQGRALRAGRSGGGFGLSGLPSIAHAVGRLDGVERRVDRGELAPDALDVGGNRAVVDDQIRLAHQLVAALDVLR